jgi:transposase
LGRTSAAGAERNPAPCQRQTAKPDKAEFVVCESTIYNRFVRWRETGVWDRILNAVSAAYDGGLTTKIHALVNAEGRPIRIALTPGQAHDGTAAEELLTNMKPGATLLADKAYDSNAIRDQAQEQDIWANIPPKSNRKGSFVFSAFLYRYRNLVERFLNKLKQFRGIATRYDKNPDKFLAAIKLVSARICIRSYDSAA